MFKRIKAWIASLRRSPKEKPYTLEPAYSTGRNASKGEIRIGALVSERRVGDGIVVDILPCNYRADRGGLYRRLLAKLGVFNPHASPPIGVAAENIPKGGTGRVQIAGVMRVQAIPSDDTAV